MNVNATGWIRLVRLAVLVVGLTAAGVVGRGVVGRAGGGWLGGGGSPTVVRSDDGRFEMTVPGGWATNPAFKTKGKIHVRSDDRHAYATLLAEDKGDFDGLPLKDYAARCMESAAAGTKLAGRTQEGPTDVTVAGKPGVRYTTSGTMNGLKLEYQYTFFQTPSAFDQVSGWAAPSHFDAALADFQFMADHVREVPAAK